MITLTRDEQIAAVRRFIDAEHFRYRRHGDGAPKDGEIAVSQAWALVRETPGSPLMTCLEEDFRTFCARCLDLEFEGSGDSAPSIRWRSTNADPARRDFDRQDPANEAFTIDVGSEQVTIEAGHERGLLQATHYLERLMADRGAPRLARGRIERSPTFAPRLTNSIFIESDQDITDPDQLSDEYLGLMSHFGGNGVHLFTDLYEFCRNDVLPELNAPDFDERIDSLNRLCARANARGIDLYLCVILRVLAEDHEVFRAHPEVKGAASDVIVDLPVAQHCLCSGSDTVHRFCDQTLANLYSAAPDLAGMICLVGGEGFMHCFTRPEGDYEGGSSCPRCRDRDASTEVAALVNRAAAAVRGTGRHKSFYAWPYSAFVWSGSDDRAQAKWIEELSDDVSVMANFATGSHDVVNDDGVYLFDYNIKTIGSSTVFAEQRRRLQNRGRPIYAKVETNTTPLYFSMPYLPVHHRWHGRWRAMAAEPVAGFIGQWRFYGMNGSPPEEVQYHATWNPKDTAAEVLGRMARRDCGVDDDGAARLVEGWSAFSDAWDDLPYSAMLCGERAYYMRGPMYLGPAHPLIFDPQDDYGLSTRFRTLRGDAHEGLSEEDRELLAKTAPPRYIDQMLMAMPYGEARFLDLIGRCRARWGEGLGILREVLGSSSSERARMELDVCDMAGIHLTSVENTARFLVTRDRLWRDPLDRDGFRFSMEVLKKTVIDEIANARRALPMLHRDPRLAFNYCYGNPYDADMVQEKIAQCEHVLNTELPGFDRGMRFHLWMEFP
ncbi:MAG: hypothetical protein CMJ18_04260 [Phycisphaeraceae bacterium]|nr:hypothetical protein [Phycisphaeraceae bacterium]